MTCVQNNLLALDDICKQFELSEHFIFKDFFGFDFDFTRDIDRSEHSILSELDEINDENLMSKEEFFSKLKKIKSELFRIIKIVSHNLNVLEIYSQEVLLNLNKFQFLTKGPD